MDRFVVMTQCPKFERCNAPFCPLDPENNEVFISDDDPKCKLDKHILKKLTKVLIKKKTPATKSH